MLNHFSFANNPIFIVRVLNVDCYRKFRWRRPNVFMDINEDILKKHPYYHSKLIPPYNKDFWNEPAITGQCEKVKVSITSALCMSNFDGIHPLLRHVPTILFFSIMATLRPRWYAALATSSPEPLPITIRSNSCKLDHYENCRYYNGEPPL